MRKRECIRGGVGGESWEVVRGWMQRAKRRHQAGTRAWWFCAQSLMAALRGGDSVGQDWCGFMEPIEGVSDLSGSGIPSEKMWFSKVGRDDFCAENEKIWFQA